MKIVVNAEANAESVAAFSTAFKIIQIVAAHFQLPLQIMEGKERPWNCVWPRWLAAYFIYRYTSLSRNKIGLLLNKSNGTIIHSLRGLQKQIETSGPDAATLRFLDRQISAVIGCPVIRGEPLLSAA